MSPSHSRKATGQRYRYYVSQALLQGRADEAGSVRRVSADVIESIIDRTLCEALPQLQRKAWSTSSMDQKRIRLRRLVERVVMSRDAVEVKVTDAGREALANAESGLLSIATVLKAGLGGKQIVSRPAVSARIDRSLVKAIVWARDLRERLEREGPIAGRAGAVGGLLAALRQQHDQAGLLSTRHHAGHSRRDSAGLSDSG